MSNYTVSSSIARVVTQGLFKVGFGFEVKHLLYGRGGGWLCIWMSDKKKFFTAIYYIMLKVEEFINCLKN